MAQKGHKRALKLSYWETKGIFYKEILSNLVFEA